VGDEMNTFIELLNVFLGVYCLIGSIEGISSENWMKVCAFCLFFIAFEQAITIKGKNND
jgi:hypothetical protein